MKRFLQKRFLWTLTTLAVVVMLALPWVVFADVTVPDGDDTEPINANPLVFGDVCAGASITNEVRVAIKRAGNYGSTNVFKNGAVVTVSVQSVSGTELSPDIGSPSTITLPDDWESKPDGQYMSDSVTSNVTLHAGSAGSFSGSVTYRASGPSSKPPYSTINRDATMEVTATIIDCQPSDTERPTASPTQSPVANPAGWNNTDVTLTWNWMDNVGGSGIDEDNCEMTTVATDEGEYEVTATCYDLAGNMGQASYNVKIDKTAPTVSANASPGPNTNGWNNTNVTVSFSGSDALSGIDSCSADVVLTSEGAGQSASGTCTDKAGNVSAPATATGINIDKTPPTITWYGSIDDGDEFYFGFVPAEPTCAAVDGLSGPGSCAVTGYGTKVGSHTLTATAYDLAGNSKVETRSYTVLAWDLKGFYQPVDMNGVLNTVKGGSTVPLKFEVFAGNTELTDVSLVKSFTVKQVACPMGAYVDEIELVTTGGTVLRYDFTAGQFIQNWQTPKKPGYCYQVTMTTQDESSLSANFKVK